MGYATAMMKKTGRAMGLDTQIIEEDRYSFERNQCVCAYVKRVPETTKTRSPSPLTRPTSLEML